MVSTFPIRFMNPLSGKLMFPPSSGKDSDSSDDDDDYTPDFNLPGSHSLNPTTTTPALAAAFSVVADQNQQVAHAHVVADWVETKAEHVFVVELPGLSKDQVKVDVDDEKRVLKISGEKVRVLYSNKDEQAVVTPTWRRRERVFGKFTRSFNLPENAKVGEVKAAMIDGLLTVTVPKLEVKEKVNRSIKVVAG